jgi:modulator of FtsH protease
MTSVLLAAAGITYAVGVGGGLYWLVPAVLAALLGGALNAWTFLIELT